MNQQRKLNVTQGHSRYIKIINRFSTLMSTVVFVQKLLQRSHLPQTGLDEWVCDFLEGHHHLSSLATNLKCCCSLFSPAQASPCSFKNQQLLTLSEH